MYQPARAPAVYTASCMHIRAVSLLFALLCCGHSDAQAATNRLGDARTTIVAPFPLLPITPAANNAAPWALPNPKLPFPVGPNPGLKYEGEPRSDRRRLQPPAPKSKQGLLLGDVRVRLHVSAELAAQANSTVTAQIFWRRRDHNPEIKAVVVTDAAGAQVQSSVSALQSECGVVHFVHTGPGDYFVYYLPHTQTGGGAGVVFTWFNCTDPTHGRRCVLDTAVDSSNALLPPAGACASVDASAAAVAVSYENRPNSYGEHDHTPTGEPFHGFTVMELVALPSELATVPKGMAVYMEPRENAIRMLDRVPAHWARKSGGEVLELNATAFLGEYFTFQAGIFANGPALRNISATFSTLTGGTADASSSDGAYVIPPSAVTCFNLGGNDQHGRPFTKDYSVGAGQVGALWFGIDLPSDTSSAGTFKGTITLSATSEAGVSHTKTLHLTLTAKVPSNGKPLPLHGDDDVYSMRRLRWLDSTIGVDDEVTKPFTNITATSTSNGLSIGVVNKLTQIGPDGLPSQSLVSARKVRQGKNTSVGYEVLAEPVAFECLVGGKPVQMSVTKSAHILTHTSSTVTWQSELEGGGIALNITGAMDFDSYLEFSVSVHATAADVEVSDIILRVQATNQTAKMMCGFGVDGQYLSDLAWKWNKGQGNNRFWMGRVEAGVFVYPRGDGPDWENPNYSKDYPVLPFIPSSWGGVAATPDTNTTLTGATVNDSTVVMNSGARTLRARDAPVQFLFDMAFTPSKPLDLRHHWKSRYLQIGYGGVGYTTPEAVSKMGVTVATLHQGIGGIHNATDGTPSMVNPYINWPFVPDVVNFMEGYTQRAHALEIQVKFYYTIRELTNHVVELYALKALQGEVLTSGDPYTIPQAGFNHAWNAHGGGAYLHEHLVDDYVSCWQQGLANGETDASVCDHGTSRWFNYYLEGAFWSVNQAPHMDGICAASSRFAARCAALSICWLSDHQPLNVSVSFSLSQPLSLSVSQSRSLAVSQSRSLAVSQYACLAASDYDGINFDRRGMRRVRKVLDRASDGKKFAPLIDIHTGNIGPDSPSAVTYLSHFPYADSAWNGEGFNWAGDSAYWLTDVSGFIHGIPCDRLGGPDAIKGMLFGNYERNSGSAEPIWKFWDAIKIEDSEMIGWWEDDSPVTLSLPPPPPRKNISCVDSYTTRKDSYVGAAGGPSGVYGFGASCGPPNSNKKFPALTVAQAKKDCCTLGDDCFGFSWKTSNDPTKPADGCMQRNNRGGVTHLAGYTGYFKDTRTPNCKISDIKATTYVTFQKQAVIVVASWCSGSANVTLGIDWTQLGLDATKVEVTQPAVEGVQAALNHGSSLPVLSVSGSTNGGAMLVIKPTAS